MQRKTKRDRGRLVGYLNDPLIMMSTMVPENKGEWKLLNGECDKRSKREKARSEKKNIMCFRMSLTIIRLREIKG